MSDPPSLPVAAAASSSSAAASDYLDALGSVLSFLTLRELAAALSVSKEWSAAVHSMRPAMLSAHISAFELAALLSSRLRRHVGELGHPNDYRMVLRSHHLPMLVSALPQLTSLNAALRIVNDDAPFLFPPHMQRLHLCLEKLLSGQEKSPIALVESISRLQQLHTLRLHMPTHVHVSFVALQQLPLLRDLHVMTWFRDNEVQFATELRALPWLYRLHINLLSDSSQAPRVALFHALLGEAHEEQLRTLQWRDLNIRSLTFTDELTPLLCRMPMLERLAANLTRCRRFDFLSALPRLLSLEFQVSGLKVAVWRNLLGVFLSDGLVRLHTLAVRGGPCSSDDLRSILPHTPALTSLMLNGLHAVDSLCFFRQLPKLAESLTQLTIECTQSWRLTAADLPPLHALQQLRELWLVNWPSEEPDGLTEVDRAPFKQRPCVVLPHLELFE
jgi:hypothetical protein